MKIVLDGGGIDLSLRIREYKKNDREYPDCPWCRVDYALQSSFMNYIQDDSECLECAEVDYLYDKLRSLLEYKISKKTEIGFIEPDLSFVLYPRVILGDDHKYNGAIYREDIKELSPWAEIVFYLWDKDGALSESSIHLTLSEDDIRALVCYLQYVRLEVSEEDAEVQKYIADGLMVSDNFAKGTEFLFSIKDYLKSRGLQYETSIDDAIAARKSGKEYSLSEHLRGLVYALLTNQTKWSRIVPHLSEIDKIFFNYDVDTIKEKPAEYFETAIRGIKCGNRNIKAQMNALHENIGILESITAKYGSMDTFITSAPAYEVVSMLSSTYSEYKLQQVGEALAWEYIRNMGIDGAKPDLHLRRFFGCNRMNASNRESASIPEVIEAVASLSKASGLTMAAIDNLIWSYCADGYAEVCTATPRCADCVIKRYCQHR